MFGNKIIPFPDVFQDVRLPIDCRGIVAKVKLSMSGRKIVLDRHEVILLVGSSRVEGLFLSSSKNCSSHLQQYWFTTRVFHQFISPFPLLLLTTPVHHPLPKPYIATITS